MTTAREVATYFLRLGFTAFGGPAAHIAMMEEEVVRRRRWMTRERFLDLLAAANLIPGPSSTEMAIFIGYEQAAAVGLLAGGVCFILPAFAMVLALAWAYVRFGRLPAVAGVLYGVKPVIIAVVAQALVALGRMAVKSRFLGVLCVLALLAAVLRADPLLLLVGAGVLALAWHRGARFWHLSLFLYFLKVGAVLYGSGYVLDNNMLHARATPQTDPCASRAPVATPRTWLLTIGWIRSRAGPLPVSAWATF